MCMKVDIAEVSRLQVSFLLARWQASIAESEREVCISGFALLAALLQLPLF